MTLLSVPGVHANLRAPRTGRSRPAISLSATFSSQEAGDLREGGHRKAVLSQGLCRAGRGWASRLGVGGAVGPQPETGDPLRRLVRALRTPQVAAHPPA